MSTTATLPETATAGAGAGPRPGAAAGSRTETLDTARLPSVVWVLALGTFLMGTTEFVVAGLLPEIASDLRVSVAQAGLLIPLGAVAGQFLF